MPTSSSVPHLFKINHTKLLIPYPVWHMMHERPEAAFATTGYPVNGPSMD